MDLARRCAVRLAAPIVYVALHTATAVADATYKWSYAILNIHYGSARGARRGASDAASDAALPSQCKHLRGRSHRMNYLGEARVS